MASLERMSVRRKDPRDSDGATGGSPPLSMLEACDVDMSIRLYCKRAMMQAGLHCGLAIAIFRIQIQRIFLGKGS